MPAEGAVWAVVPLKSFALAKRRLAAVLDADERAHLSAAMAADVLSMLRSVRGVAGTAVVTPDSAVARLAAEHGARVIAEPMGRGESAAVQLAAARLAAEGVRSIAVLPGDVPLARTEEVERAIEDHAVGAAVTLVPSHDWLGTNLIVSAPPEVLPFHFGPNSYRRHVASARARGIECRTLVASGISLDVDLPRDLEALMRAPGTTRAQAYLARIWPGRRRRGDGAESRRAPLEQHT